MNSINPINDPIDNPIDDPINNPINDLIDPHIEDRLKSLGTSWLKVTSWLLQENLYWPKFDKNN